MKLLRLILALCCAAPAFAQKEALQRAVGTNTVTGSLSSTPFQVATIAALKAVAVTNIPDGTSVNITGYYAAGDGGQGDFKYSAASAVADNGGYVIAPNAGSGRWLRAIGDTVTVKQFGAVGDGVADDTTEIAAAMNYANGKRVFLPSGVYLVTDKLALTVWKYSIYGERVERGTNAMGANSSYPQTTIKFRPVDTTKFLIERYDATAPFSGLIGPFIHTDITFDLSTASGLMFGNETIDPVVTDGATQKYVFGVQFSGCAFHSATGVTSSGSGNLVRTGRKQIWLTKCFEALIDNCSFSGSDVQIRTWGCDRPMITHVRAQSSNIPFDFNASGTFSVQHSLNDIEMEGWNLVAISNNGTKLSIDNLSLENNSNIETGRLNLTSLYGITAAVTAGSGTLTFSTSMTNKLHAGYSIIQLTDGTNTDYALVTGVSGTSVTVDTTNFRFTWTNAAASVTRLQGHGVLHQGNFTTNITNVTGGPATDTPAFTYCVGRGSMMIANASTQRGSYNDVRSIVIGNFLVGAFFMDSQMTFSNCSTTLCADPNNPFVSISTVHDVGIAQNGYAAGVYRPSIGQMAVEESRVNRIWVFTPKNSGTANSNKHLTTLKQIDGDANTAQKEWVWLINSTIANTLIINNDGTPSTSAGFMRIKFRVRTVSGSGTLAVTALGNGGGAVQTFDIDATMKTVQYVGPIPPNWVGARNTNAGFQITASADTYLVGVVIEDTSMAQEFDWSSGGAVGLKRASRVSGIVLSTDTTIVTFDGTKFSSGQIYGAKIRLVSTLAGAGLEGYTTVISEFLMTFSKQGSTYQVTTAPALIQKAQSSINAGVLSIDQTMVGAISGSSILAKVNVTGSGSAIGSITGAITHWELELLGDTGTVLP